jgi:hypothetical protein
MCHVPSSFLLKQTVEFYSIIINASIASGLGIFLLYKLKFHRLQPNRFKEAVAVGLVLWLSADIVCAIYQLLLLRHGRQLLEQAA